jgi:DNA-3-methyladenine glycosylase I
MSTTKATDTPPPTPVRRCFGDGDPLYEAYHDTEWGRPVRGEAALLERLVLEGFQSGLSWLTILRKRPAFRVRFANFEPEILAGFTPEDISEAMLDAGIVRNRRKIEAAVTNARAVVRLHEAGRALTDLIWDYAPPSRSESQRPLTPADMVVAPEAYALAKELKRLGFTFTGPTTCYSMMQACGLVDDHLAGCPIRVNSFPATDAGK